MKKKSTQVHISQRWALLFLFKWQGSSMWGGNPLKQSVLEKVSFHKRGEMKLDICFTLFTKRIPR